MWFRIARRRGEGGGAERDNLGPNPCEHFAHPGCVTLDPLMCDIARGTSRQGVVVWAQYLEDNNTRAARAALLR